MSHKINEHKDNIRKIKETIENTQHNIEAAYELIDASTDANYKQSLSVQNDHRQDVIDTLQDNLKDKIGKKNNSK